jgi:ABC-type multidrug transport system permease subunit
MDKCTYNRYVSDGTQILTQVILIFAFLTVFFFTYVAKVEKEEFEHQIHIIVDEFMKDVDISDLPQDYDTDFIIDAFFGGMNGNIKRTSVESVKEVNDMNDVVKINVYKKIVIFSLIVLLISLIAGWAGWCVSIKNNFKEGLYIVFFVGLTEYLFLTLIAANYISASPNMVKRLFGESIKKWIREKHPVS